MTYAMFYFHAGKSPDETHVPRRLGDLMDVLDPRSSPMGPMSEKGQILLIRASSPALRTNPF